MSRRLTIMVLVLASQHPTLAGAATSTVSASQRDLLWPTAGAIVPGLLVHGSGHFIAGDSGTGWRLLATEGVGVALAVGGVGGLAATGASPKFVGPLAVSTIAGVGLFAFSFFSDLYGVISPHTGTGRVTPLLPRLSAELGLRYVHDPTADYRVFAGAHLTLRTGRWRIRPGGWVSLDDANARLRLEGAFRLLGRRPGRRAGESGSFLDAVAAVTHHHYGSDGFGVTTLELMLASRYDLAGFGRTLAGSFVEFSVGGAAELYDFGDTPLEGHALLLARFAWGLYLGERAEASIYYDHRHDGFAAGLKIPGLGSGAAGHFGLRGRFIVTDEWGLIASAETGSAHVVTLALIYRYGGSP